MSKSLNFKKEKGQGMVEYALIIVLVAVVLIVVLALVGSQVSTVFSQIVSGLTVGGGGSGGNINDGKDNVSNNDAQDLVTGGCETSKCYSTLTDARTVFCSTHSGMNPYYFQTISEPQMYLAAPTNSPQDGMILAPQDHGYGQGAGAPCP